MTGYELLKFRKMVKLSQRKMAAVLGYSLRSYQGMEQSTNDIRAGVGLACAAYALGIRAYDGPVIEAIWKQNHEVVK